MGLFRKMSFWPETAEQWEWMKEALTERRSIPVAERYLYPAPEFVDESVVGAFYWAMQTIWQDRPGFVIFAVFCWVTVLYYG